MIDVMLSKATEGMLIAELLNRRNDKEVPLFMGKSILLPMDNSNYLQFFLTFRYLQTYKKKSN